MFLLLLLDRRRVERVEENGPDNVGVITEGRGTFTTRRSREPKGNVTGKGERSHGKVVEDWIMTKGNVESSESRLREPLQKDSGSLTGLREDRGRRGGT